jgi:hypothetical protein
MHRIDGAGATVLGQFTEGNPAGGIPATKVTGDWLNAIQEEILAVVEDAGLPPVKAQNNQLLQALNAIYGGMGGSNRVGFTRGGTGSVPRTVQTKLRELTVSVFDFNNVGGFATALQSAIDYLEAQVGALNYGGGIIDIPAGDWRPNAKVTISKSFITLRGAGTQATSITFANGAQDCIEIDGGVSGLRDVRILDMSVNGDGLKTAGAAIKLRNAYRCVFQRLAVEYCITGFDIGAGTNDITIRDTVIVPNQAASVAGIWWHCPTDGSARSDVLTLHNVVVSAQWSNATCMLWEGWCNTTVWSHVRFLHAAYGLRVRNPAPSSSYYPQFLNAHDLEAEGFKVRAVSIEAGACYKIVASDINNLTGGHASQGNADNHALAIIADNGASFTRSIQIGETRIGLCRSAAVYNEGWDVQLSNIIGVSASMSAIGASPVVHLAANSRNVQVVNLRAEEYGGAGKASYGVQIENGALDIQVDNIDATYVQTGAVNNLSTSSRVSIGACVEPGGKASGCNVASGNFERQMLHDRNGDWISKVVNASTGANATARRDYSTGLANNFVIQALKNNAGAPLFHESCGSAVGEWLRDGPKHRFRNQSGVQQFVIGEALPNFADDTAAKAGGVPQYGYYRNGSGVQQRVLA